MIERIDHTGLVVSDLAKSIEFYTKMLGFEVLRTVSGPGRELVYLSMGASPAATLELLKFDSTDLSVQVPDNKVLDNQRLVGLRHLAFHVSDVAGTFEALREKGVEMLDNSPFQRPDGPPIAFGLDPDGVLLEFTEL
jgi:catechol 2,3-dioxygenase-like lactoylglutathione lyase family enzyme